MKKVALALSGGVDSALSAALLQEQGFSVVAFFMKNWEEHEDEDFTCPATQDFEDALRVAEHLKIPLYNINLAKEYWEDVFAFFLQELQQGRTPNPDILCNKKIKFHHFLKKIQALETDFLATGHYCRTDEQGRLYRGLDARKDQSYFLHTVPRSVFAKTLFPIGSLEKSLVRSEAKKRGLPIHDKKDSTGICFIGKRKFQPFIRKYLKNISPGFFEDCQGNILGTHQGLPFYTIGQRKGLGIGGPGEAWFVVDKDIARNVIVLGQGYNHPLLFSSSLLAEQPFLPSLSLEHFPFSCTAKVRYRQEDSPCTIFIQDDLLRVQFTHPQRAVTPGQSIVFYNQTLCLGGAIIKTIVL